MRVPEDAPYAEPKRPRSKVPRRPKERPRSGDPRRGRSGVGPIEPEATRGGPSSKTRRAALAFLREMLHEYDHAIEPVPRGLEVDLRGVAFGLARTLVKTAAAAGGAGQE